MSNITELTIKESRQAIEKKQFSCLELVDAYLQNMDRFQGLNAFITKTPDQAREAARLSDVRYGNGTARMLEGMPIAVKDLFCTKGVRTTAASKILENFVPTYESTVTQNLLDAGCVFLGKTNLDEFAMGASNMTSAFGPVENPWRSKTNPAKKLVPGGSSGGSAAAVAGHMAIAATGTDTGGSTRQPGSFTGTVGMKPTYGRCSRWGIVAFASSLDQAGIFAKTTEDAALLMNVMCGYDPKDSTSAMRDVPDFTALIANGVKGLRIGIPKEYRVDGLDPDVNALWDQGIAWLKSEGAEIRDISLPHSPFGVATYYILAPAEASSNLARYDGVRYGLRVEGKDLNDTYAKSRAAGFGAEVTRRIMIGTYALSSGYYDAYYTQAQKIRRLVANDFKTAFESVDAILSPTAPGPAFGIGDNMDDPVQMYLCDVFTIPASLAGLPGISVPAGLSRDGLPLGLQVIGRAWDEETMFRVAQTVERAAAFPRLRLADTARAA